MFNFLPSSARRGGPSFRSRGHVRPGLESLEDRLVPALIFVHNHSDGASMPFVGNMAPNLRSAIDQSNPGDVIELDNATYTLTGGAGGNELDVSHTLVIRNAGGGASTIDGQGVTRVFEIDNGATVTMTGLIVEGGNGNGSGEGGGILVGPGTKLTLDTDRVTLNDLVAGTPAQGGGIFNGGTLTVINTNISQNFISGKLNATNSGSVEGAGIYSSGKLTLTNSVLYGNEALGGSVHPEGGSEQGEPAFGAGLFLAATEEPVSAVISGTSFLQNGALGGVGGGSAAGGGLYQDAGTGSVTIKGSTFYKNTATGGASSGGAGTVAGNAFGGGLYQNPGAGGLSIFNSTFANNKAVGGFTDLPGATAGNATGGGLFLADTIPGLLVNDTIAQNSAAPSAAGGFGTAGGVFVEGDPKVWNTLIAENSAATDPDVDGPFLSLGHNLFGNTTGSSGFSAAKHDLLNIPTSQIGLDNIADNGGPTATMRLEPFSLAVDHGDNFVLALLSTDQRGLPRLSGSAVDIGAYELQIPSSHGRRNGP
ncbi:MAG TPA: choice-of-anchor Q domain-containing protein [Gemmataceae bacterium]|nr:choice-of-anchor Q domain-containing protein [Gemmataceae bacterium]